MHMFEFFTPTIFIIIVLNVAAMFFSGIAKIIAIIASIIRGE
jgi:hypothetical protein